MAHQDQSTAAGPPRNPGEGHGGLCVPERVQRVSVGAHHAEEHVLGIMFYSIDIQNGEKRKRKWRRKVKGLEQSLKQIVENESADWLFLSGL